VSWSDTQIVATVPTGATTGPVSVTVNSIASNQNQVFTLPSPTVTGISPGIGPAGTQVQVTGTGFGTTQGSSTLVFTGQAGIGTVTATASAWSNTQITATVPATAITGVVRTVVGGVTSNTNGANVYFNILIPRIDSISPTAGGSGNQVTITGVNFQATQGASYVVFGGQVGPVVSWSDSQIVATVPIGASPATVSVRVYINGAYSNGINFTIPSQIVSSVSPTVGPAGMQVTIAGSGFGSSQGTSVLSFNGTTATSIASWSSTQIVATVPATASTGPVVVTANSIPGNINTIFTVAHPVISSVVPPAAAHGATIMLYGTGFISNGGGGNSVFINGQSAPTYTWTDTSIQVGVPSAATSGPITVNVYSAVSNAVSFDVLPAPTVTSITPSIGAVGSSVTVTGTGFGATQSTSILDFYGVVATITSWSDTSIQAIVPANASTGPVNVTVGGLVGTGATFTVNITVGVQDSLSHNSSYTSVMTGGVWALSDSSGPGCATCSRATSSWARHIRRSSSGTARHARRVAGTPRTKGSLDASSGPVSTIAWRSRTRS